MAVIRKALYLIVRFTFVQGLPDAIAGHLVADCQPCKREGLTRPRQRGLPVSFDSFGMLTRSASLAAFRRGWRSKRSSSDLNPPFKRLLLHAALPCTPRLIVHPMRQSYAFRMRYLRKAVHEL